MLGLILTVASFIACFVFMVKMVLAMKWHGGVMGPGIGERKGKAEYGRIKRESPTSADAQLSEAEFVEKFISTRPRPARYVMYVLAICFVLIPVSCTMMVTSVR